MIHQLKIDEKYFRQKANGGKRWEIRKDDRGFRIGDLLGLNETEDGKETGCCMIEMVTEIIGNAPGTQPSYVILSTIGMKVGIGQLVPDGVSIHGERNRIGKESASNDNRNI